MSSPPAPTRPRPKPRMRVAVPKPIGSTKSITPTPTSAGDSTSRSPPPPSLPQISIEVDHVSSSMAHPGGSTTTRFDIERFSAKGSEELSWAVVSPSSDGINFHTEVILSSGEEDESSNREMWSTERERKGKSITAHPRETGDFPFRSPSAQPYNSRDDAGNDDDDKGDSEDDDIESDTESNKKRRKPKRKFDWTVSQEDVIGLSSEDSDDGSTSRAQRRNKKEKGRLSDDEEGGNEDDLLKSEKQGRRARSISLTPPPEMDAMIYHRVENVIRNALADDNPNPLLKATRHPLVADSDSDLEFLEAPSSLSQPNRNDKHSNRVDLCEDSDEEIQFVLTPPKRSPALPISEPAWTGSDLSRLSATPAPPVVVRNPLTIGAPDDVTIRLKVVAHHPAGSVSERAIQAFEKPLVFAVHRFHSLFDVTDEGAKRKGYKEPLVITYEGKRVYPSTTPDTLGIFHSAEMVGYRKDIYTVKEKEIEEERRRNIERIAQEAQEASLVRAEGHGGDHDEDDDGRDLFETRQFHSPRLNAGLNPSSHLSIESKRSSTSREIYGLSKEHSMSISSVHDDDNGKATEDDVRAEGIQIVLRGRTGGDVRVMAKASSKVSSLLKHYGIKLGLTKHLIGRLSIEFDGERLNGTDTLADTEIEDGDCLSVMGM
ncbi:Rad60/SUMO-like domain [Phaffia rhodozyma]|uniref:Rad60/SUMO-like domain n=1 Tax=Phaffia rhodozyma TaxID=264483 RepID=A0A0F7SPF5_PHARH|nr:Rad60/SUMO-like domain [Phaffia rhodozyma]